MDTVKVSQIYHVERKLIRFEYRRRRRPCSKGRGGGIRVSSQTKASLLLPLPFMLKMMYFLLVPNILPKVSYLKSLSTFQLSTICIVCKEQTHSQGTHRHNANSTTSFPPCFRPFLMLIFAFFAKEGFFLEICRTVYDDVLPEHDNDAIKDIEAIADVSEKSVRQ